MPVDASVPRRVAAIVVLAALIARAVPLEAGEYLVAILGEEPNVIAVFKRQLRFLRLPRDIRRGVDKQGRARLLRGKVAVDPRSLTESGRMEFKHQVNVAPLDNRPRYLICTNVLTQRLPAGLDDFCGVVSVEGKVVHRFALAQRRPDRVAWPIDVSGDGGHAEVAVGKEGGRDKSRPVHQFQRILAWDYPDKATEVPPPPAAKDPWRELRKGFAQRAKAARADKGGR